LEGDLVIIFIEFLGVTLLALLRTSTLSCQVVEPRLSEDGRPGDMLPTLENVTNFISALRALSFPASAIFSLPDLESTGWEER
jgi:hypothetical protein